eukprot:129390-Pyramimonas_sp.AAC.1
MGPSPIARAHSRYLARAPPTPQAARRPRGARTGLGAAPRKTSRPSASESESDITPRVRNVEYYFVMMIIIMDPASHCRVYITNLPTISTT